MENPNFFNNPSKNRSCLMRNLECNSLQNIFVLQWLGNCKIQCHQFHSGWLINPWRYARQPEPQVSLSWLTNVSPNLYFHLLESQLQQYTNGSFPKNLWNGRGRPSCPHAPKCWLHFVCPAAACSCVFWRFCLLLCARKFSKLACASFVFYVSGIYLTPACGWMCPAKYCFHVNIPSSLCLFCMIFLY